MKLNFTFASTNRELTLDIDTIIMDEMGYISFSRCPEPHVPVLNDEVLLVAKGYEPNTFNVEIVDRKDMKSCWINACRTQNP